MIWRILFLMFALALPLSAADCFTAATNLAKLIAPTKLAKLGAHGIDPIIYKAVAMVEDVGPGCAWWFVTSNAVLYAAYTNVHLAKLTREALLNNWGNAAGDVTAEGMAEMRLGKAPTIQSGTFAGAELVVDHIISPSVAPELVNVIANVELVVAHPMNLRNGSKMGKRQRELAVKFHKGGLLTKERLNEILRSK